MRHPLVSDLDALIEPIAVFLPLGHLSIPRFPRLLGFEKSVSQTGAFTETLYCTTLSIRYPWRPSSSADFSR